ncbi:MAG: hypothetical protein AABX93_01845, partial [Nanoarchaeota archaeon]
EHMTVNHGVGGSSPPSDVCKNWGREPRFDEKCSRKIITKSKVKNLSGLASSPLSDVFSEGKNGHSKIL